MKQRWSENSVLGREQSRGGKKWSEGEASREGMDWGHGHRAEQLGGK